MLEKLLLGKPYEEHTTKNTLSLYWNLLSKEITSFKLISEALKKHSIRSASTKITFAASFFYNAFLGSEDLSHKEILSNSALSAVATYSALFIGGLVLGAISKGKETKNLDKVLGSNWHLSHKGKNQNAGLEKLILKEVLEEELAIKGKILTEEEKEQELKYLKSYLALFSALPCESYMKNFSCDFSIAQGWLDLPIHKRRHTRTLLQCKPRIQRIDKKHKRKQHQKISPRTANAQSFTINKSCKQEINSPFRKRTYTTKPKILPEKNFNYT